MAVNQEKTMNGNGSSDQKDKSENNVKNLEESVRKSTIKSHTLIDTNKKKVKESGMKNKTNDNKSSTNTSSIQKNKNKTCQEKTNSFPTKKVPLTQSNPNKSSSSNSPPNKIRPINRINKNSQKGINNSKAAPVIINKSNTSRTNITVAATRSVKITGNDMNQTKSSHNILGKSSPVNSNKIQTSTLNTITKLKSNEKNKSMLTNARDGSLKNEGKIINKTSVVNSNIKSSNRITNSTLKVSASKSNTTNTNNANKKIILKNKSEKQNTSKLTTGTTGIKNTVNNVTNKTGKIKSSDSKNNYVKSTKHSTKVSAKLAADSTKISAKSSTNASNKFAGDNGGKKSLGKNVETSRGKLGTDKGYEVSSHVNEDLRNSAINSEGHHSLPSSSPPIPCDDTYSNILHPTPCSDIYPNNSSHSHPNHHDNIYLNNSPQSYSNNCEDIISNNYCHPSPFSENIIQGASEHTLSCPNTVQDSNFKDLKDHTELHDCFRTEDMSVKEPIFNSQSSSINGSPDTMSTKASPDQCQIIPEILPQDSPDNNCANALPLGAPYISYDSDRDIPSESTSVTSSTGMLYFVQ